MVKFADRAKHDIFGDELLENALGNSIVLGQMDDGSKVALFLDEDRDEHYFTFDDVEAHPYRVADDEVETVLADLKNHPMTYQIVDTYDSFKRTNAPGSLIATPDGRERFVYNPEAYARPYMRGSDITAENVRWVVVIKNAIDEEFHVSTETAVQLTNPELWKRIKKGRRQVKRGRAIASIWDELSRDERVSLLASVDWAEIVNGTESSGQAFQAASEYLQANKHFLRDVPNVEAHIDDQVKAAFQRSLWGHAEPGKVSYQQYLDYVAWRNATPKDQLTAAMIERAQRDYSIFAAEAKGKDVPAVVTDLAATQTERFGSLVEATGPDPTKKFAFRYRVVPLASLIASHDVTGAVNDEFPQELQPRLRDRETSRQQIFRIAKDLEPAALLEDVKALDRGPMIVGSDMVVESGNGRTLGLQLAVLEHPESYQRYVSALRDSLKDYGLNDSDLADMENPVLVRQRLTDVDRVKFAALANQSQGLTMSPLEQALQDSNRLTDESLAKLEITDAQGLDQALRATANKPLVTQFLQGLPQNETASMLDSSGNLNSVGLQRLKAAMFARVYPGEAGQRLTAAFFESIDPQIKTIENAMADSLPQMAQSEGLARSGERQSDLTIAEDLSKAIDMFARLKQDGMSVDDFLAQKGFFERELTPEQEKILVFLNENSRSRKRVREFMRSYAKAVIDSPHPAQASMFAEAEESKTDVLERLIAAQESEAQGGQQGLFGLIAAREQAATFGGGQRVTARGASQESAPAASTSQELARSGSGERTEESVGAAGSEATGLEDEDATTPAPDSIPGLIEDDATPDDLTTSDAQAAAQPAVARVLTDSPKTIDYIAGTTGLSGSVATEALLMLQRDGKAVQTIDGWHAPTKPDTGSGSSVPRIAILDARVSTGLGGIGTTITAMVVGDRLIFNNIIESPTHKLTAPLTDDWRVLPDADVRGWIDASGKSASRTGIMAQRIQSFARNPQKFIDAADAEKTVDLQREREENEFQANLASAGERGFGFQEDLQPGDILEDAGDGSRQVVTEVDEEGGFYVAPENEPHISGGFQSADNKKFYKKVGAMDLAANLAEFTIDRADVRKNDILQDRSGERFKVTGIEDNFFVEVQPEGSDPLTEHRTLHAEDFENLKLVGSDPKFRPQGIEDEQRGSENVSPGIRAAQIRIADLRASIASHEHDSAAFRDNPALQGLDDTPGQRFRQRSIEHDQNQIAVIEEFLGDQTPSMDEDTIERLSNALGQDKVTTRNLIARHFPEHERARVDRLPKGDDTPEPTATIVQDESGSNRWKVEPNGERGVLGTMTWWTEKDARDSLRRDRNLRALQDTGEVPTPTRGKKFNKSEWGDFRSTTFIESLPESRAFRAKVAQFETTMIDRIGRRKYDRVFNINNANNPDRYLFNAVQSMQWDMRQEAGYIGFEPIPRTPESFGEVRAKLNTRLDSYTERMAVMDNDELFDPATEPQILVDKFGDENGGIVQSLLELYHDIKIPNHEEARREGLPGWSEIREGTASLDDLKAKREENRQAAQVEQKRRSDAHAVAFKGLKQLFIDRAERGIPTSKGQLTRLSRKLDPSYRFELKKWGSSVETYSAVITSPLTWARAGSIDNEAYAHVYGPEMENPEAAIDGLIHFIGVWDGQWTTRDDAIKEAKKRVESGREITTSFVDDVTDAPPKPAELPRRPKSPKPEDEPLPPAAETQQSESDEVRTYGRFLGMLRNSPGSTAMGERLVAQAKAASVAPGQVLDDMRGIGVSEDDALRVIGETYPEFNERRTAENKAVSYVEDKVAKGKAQDYARSYMGYLRAHRQDEPKIPTGMNAGLAQRVRVDLNDILGPRASTAKAVATAVKVGKPDAKESYRRTLETLRTAPTTDVARRLIVKGQAADVPVSQIFHDITAMDITVDDALRVMKRKFPEFVARQQQANKERAAAAARASGLAKDGAKKPSADRPTVKFDNKPSIQIRKRLKDNQFRWNRQEQHWRGPNTPQAQALAAELNAGVTAGTSQVDAPRTKPSEKPASEWTPVDRYKHSVESLVGYKNPNDELLAVLQKDAQAAHITDKKFRSDLGKLDLSEERIAKFFGDDEAAQVETPAEIPETPSERRRRDPGSPGEPAQVLTQEEAKARFLNLAPDHPYSRVPAADVRGTSNRVAPAVARTKEDLELQREWRDNPGALDFEGVDTKGAIKFVKRPKPPKRRRRGRRKKTQPQTATVR